MNIKADTYSGHGVVGEEPPQQPEEGLNKLFQSSSGWSSQTIFTEFHSAGGAYNAFQTP